VTFLTWPLPAGAGAQGLLQARLSMGKQPILRIVIQNVLPMAGACPCRLAVSAIGPLQFDSYNSSLLSTP
jgi:hypothetical protein